MGEKNAVNRVRLFKLFSVLLPILFICILESVLILFGYGHSYDVFEVDESNSFKRLSSEVSKKYFLQNENATFGFDEPFSIIKPKKTFRIFVLGASTAVGFPYYHNGSFHRMLNYRLQRTYPDIDFEVVNLGLTAVNSYTLVDFSYEVADNDPDAVIIYAGHNEYYGALGVASTSRMGRNPTFVKTLLKLREFRSVQLFLNFKKSIFKLVSDEVDISQTLMKRMAEGQIIEKDSKIYHQGLTQFETNLKEIYNVLSEKQIPTFVGVLVSNLADQEPFYSTFQKRHIEKLTDIEVALTKQTKDSISMFENLLKIDSTSALVHFKYAKLLRDKGDFNAAKYHFIKAKEFDLLRFRAPEKMNQLIIEHAMNFQNISIVDIESAFENNSENGFIGNDLILEHLHPNYKGYFLLANSFYDAIVDRLILPKPSFEPTKEELWEELPFLKVDSLFANYKTMLLMEQWPFNEPIGELKKEEDKTFEEKIAGGLSVRTIEWGDAMNVLYDHYIKNADYRSALKINQSLVMEFPNDLRFYYRAIKHSQQLKNYDLAFFYSKKAFKIKPNTITAKNAFINALRLDKTREAIPFIQYSIDMGKKNLIPMYRSVIDIEEMKGALEKDAKNIAALKQIAFAYVQIRNSRAAKKYVDMILNIDPSDIEAGELKKIL